MYKVILFDLDDTLIYFNDYWEISVKDTFRKHLSTKDFEPDNLFEVYKEKDLFYEQQYLKQEITIEEYRNNRLISTLYEFDKSIDFAFASDFEDLYKSISKTNMRLNHELVEFLEILQERYILGIVTNGTASWQYDKIEAIGLKHIFQDEVVFISEEIGYEKPSPEIYKKALDYFNVSSCETLFVGDSWQNDVLGPSKLGIHTVWLNRRKKAIPDDYKPIGIIEDIFELKNILG